MGSALGRRACYVEAKEDEQEGEEEEKERTETESFSSFRTQATFGKSRRVHCLTTL